MRIKRIELIGFKSFCDRAVIQIDSSIIAVVGPNGCGKSNIVDAIRWCMGEQSAKHLRGKDMADVIFNGSESRGPSPMAEVTLTFDEVGFSHETLELARHADDVEAEKTLDALVPDGEPAVAPATEGTWVDAEGKPVPSPQQEVAKVLADAPAAFEFARYTEVAITRRLYRDGTSQYFINKSPCRLRDITDFFLGTGVGTKAYSIIEQGRIGQIVSARPVDRRAIIEEAAGITKFKSKKRAAEKKLDQTRQNLMRVSDIVVELDKRMGTLRRQAQKAERYRKYKTELRDIELWKASHRWLELAAEQRLVAGRLGEVRGELDDARAAYAAKDAHVVAERAELSVEERRLVGVQDLVYELDNRIRLGDGKIGFERHEADELDARARATRDEARGLADQRERGAGELTARQHELAELTAEAAREQLDVGAREAEVETARTAAHALQARLDDARSELGTRRTDVATADAKLDALVRRRDEAARRLERVVADTDQHTERVGELEREGRRVDKELATLRQTRLDLGTQSEGFVARREQLAEDVARGEAEVETLRTELHRRRSRLVSLAEIQERYEGFQRGTRAVMQQASEIAAGAIRGVVADVVRAPEQLEVAVEAALGDRLGGVLVAEPEAGLAAIGFLKHAGAGRSAFVPVETRRAIPERVGDTVSAPAWPRDALAAAWSSPYDGGGPGAAAIEVEDRSQLVAAARAVGGEGVLGRMAELVGFADGYESVGKRLLGGTVVVDDLAHALALHQAGVSDRLVTLDGDVIDDDGVVAGGSRDAQGSGVLAQKREIRELEDIVGRLEHDLGEATARLVTAKTELSRVTKALDGLRGQVHDGEVAIVGRERDDARVRAELERHRGELGRLGTERLELEHRLRAIEIDDTAARDAKTTAITAIETLERAQLELVSAAAAERARLDELAAALTEAKVRAAQLGEKRASADAAVARLAALDAELALRGERLVVEGDDAARRAGELRERCAELARELDEQRERRQGALGELEIGRRAYDGRLTALTEIELAARELRQRIDALASEAGQLELRDGQIASFVWRVVDGIAERYQVDVAAVVFDYHLRAPVTEVEDARAGELRELVEKMGVDINLTAIEEFAETSQRFEFLSAQKTDLEHAVDQLQRAIDKINRTSRKLFKDTFAAVDQMFRQVYPRLFRGGQAHLSLSQPERAAVDPGGSAPPAKEVDILEAGIEIFAQPPGKKNATVDQLSGGEKALTAVALVFSIFLIKPSPFCILDEVDAPLDEANVDRYNELVREMTDRSQFIVISHNKRTMESADALYGVTMQEPGVSKLVSVNLARISKAAADSATTVAI